MIVKKRKHKKDGSLMQISLDCYSLTLFSICISCSSTTIRSLILTLKYSEIVMLQGLSDQNLSVIHIAIFKAY